MNEIITSQQRQWQRQMMSASSITRADWDKPIEELFNDNDVRIERFFSDIFKKEQTKDADKH